MDLRPERSTEILSQLGFPTGYFTSILGLTSARNPFTFELIAATQVLTAHVAMGAKFHLACRRPDQIAPVMPMIQTPAHPTYPSAHAAEAFAVATVIEGLLQAIATTHHFSHGNALRLLTFKLAERIAENRVIAGVHYPIDSWAGATIGEAVGRLILRKCGIAAALHPAVFEATNLDFSVAAFRPDLWPGDARSCAKLTRAPTPIEGPNQSPLFAWLWRKSLDEFQLS